ncbi:unnamed protein product [Brassica oleracea var. botrytis]|nr:unnamed protein product [Brassica napus]
MSMIWFRPPLPPMPPPSLSGSEGDSRFPESSIQTFDETKNANIISKAKDFGSH